MRKIYILFFVLLSFSIFSQTGTEFWLAPPNVTDEHRPSDKLRYFINVTGLDTDADLHIWQPANTTTGYDTTFTLLANTSQKIYLGHKAAELETKPTNTVLNTGFYIESTNGAKISAYYEYDNLNNPDIFALKGANSLGTEFYIPLHNHTLWHNHNFTNDLAYASFDIVATEDNTTVLIFPSKDVDGHPALQQFSVTLNRGQTYSCGYTGTNHIDPSNHPYGSSVTSDKPIAISTKDDSDHGIHGCYDLLGDQIVPVDIVGTEYIVVRGALNDNEDESFFVLATQNNTEITITNDDEVFTKTLFAGELFRYEIAEDVSGSANARAYNYIQASAPVYLSHVTGFGCEMGQALLPPLNCAGSEEVSFVRSTDEGFFLTLLVKTPSIGDFTITPSSAQTAIDGATWATVPGTGGDWSATSIEFSTTEIPTGGANRLVNSTDVFAMGLINGGSTSGCRYGYFSEFVAKTVTDAGVDFTICANSTATLNGNVHGGATTGIWTTSGTGNFDDATNFNAVYTPSTNDINAGSVTLTLTSTGICFPESDDMVLSFDPAPTVDAGTDQTVCANNVDANLNGTITIADGGIWTTSGDGSFDNATSMTAVYTAGPNDISNGSVRLYLTTTGNYSCNAEVDSVDITITPAPTINAGIDQTVCSNNPTITLNATTNGVPTGAIWSGGNGSYNPGSNFLNTDYTPSGVEVSIGSLTLTVTTTGSTGCLEVSDDITITFSASPVVNAGADQTMCANNAATVLNGTISGGASAGIWTNGNGTFVVDDTDLGATYTPTSTEIGNGSVTLTLTSTDHGAYGCVAESDQMTINFTPAPTADAGADQTVCANNSDVSLSGSVTIASGGVWSTAGSGTFSSNTNLTTTYYPSASDVTAGSVKIYLTTTGNASCNEVKDSMTVTITAAPIVNAGADFSVCSNNADIVLNGNVTGATAWQWTGGAGAWNPGNTALNTTYSPSGAEISNGDITLTLTTTAQGNCNAVSDDIKITFTPKPNVNAGVDQVKCENNPSTVLNGTITDGASAGIWTNGNGTFVVDDTDLGATYTPTQTEISNGSVTLTLTSTDHANNGCSAESSQMTISFTSAPTVDAGPTDVYVCQNNATVILNGSSSTGSGQWSGGSGTFADANSLNTTYEPSATEIANATPVTLTLSTTGNGSCLPETDQITVNFDPAPIVEAGNPQTSCANNPIVTLQGSVTNAAGGSWSGSTGSFSPSNAALNATFSPTTADIAAGGVDLTLTSTGNADCNAETDIFHLTIVPSPIVDAGVDDSYCKNNATISLSGTVTNATGGTWSGGLGIYGDVNSLNTTYQPTQDELDDGYVTLYLTSTGNGTCNAVQDEVTYTFTDAPVVDAGIAQSVCANNSDVALNGSVTVATGGEWSGGLGTYSPDNTTLNAVYHPHPSEIANQTVTLTLTSTGNGSCNLVSDDVTITIVPSPIVDAGSDIHSCYNNPTATLNGTVTNAPGGTWSGGAGTFTPNNTTLNADYTPTQSEIDAGIIKLYLTSASGNSCNPVIDSLNIIIDPKPIVNAGVDQSICSNNAGTLLDGSVSLASGGIWSNGAGSFSPNNSVLNATYTPTQGEINNGFVELILTSTGNGSCNAEDDTMRITFTPAPTVDAGTNFEVCANNNQIDLAGTVTVATSGTWSGGAGTYNPDANSLTTSYTPTPTEISNGSVVLWLTSSGNGNCSAVQDSIAVTINESPIVDAGTDQNVCVDNLDVHLNGSVSGITNTGIWTTSGTGTFNDNTALNAIYTCSSADSTVGTVTLTLTSTNNDVCLSESDDVVLHILPAGIADAGTDQTVCANNAEILLNGTVSGGASSGVWSTSGTGTFIPDANTLNATYIPSANDTATGLVTLTLTANSCNLSESSIDITITPAPYINAGPDQIICVDDLNVQLDGTAYGASNTAEWTSLGTGTFVPNNTTLDAIYHASAQDSINGQVMLLLSSTNYGACNLERDTMIITISPAGIVDAGPDQTHCANNTNIELNGSISGGASEGQWATSGSGYFSPSADSLHAYYTPGAADITAGTVTLVLSATNSCNLAFDAVTITLTPAPTADAGIDQSLCANNSDLVLNGSVTLATGGEWTSTGTGSFASSTSLNTIYTPSAADIAAGGADIILTTTGNGGCLPVSDTLNFEITPSPIVDAGANQSVCSSATSTDLYGSVTGVTNTGVWSLVGAASGTFDDVNDLSTTYTFSGADIASGTIQLALTSTNNGGCNAVSDTITITFGNSTFAYAGVDQIICGDDLNVNLNGIVSGGTSTGYWSTDSNPQGIFTPDSTSLNATYTCSSQDSINGFVNIILTTTNNGGCTAGKDTMLVTITPVPVVNAGADIEACKGVDSVAISGTILNINSAVWTTSGSGIFTPSADSLNAYYLPSTADTLIGSVVLTLTSENSGICNEVSDQVNVLFTVPLNVDFAVGLACLNQTVNFADSTTITAGSIDSWHWDFGDGTTDNNQNPTHTYTSDGNYTVTLTVESSLGCTYYTTKTITVYKSPTADFTYSSNCYLDDVVFTDASIANAGTINSWYWTFVDSLHSTMQNPTFLFDNSGTYTVVLSVQNSLGCSASASLPVEVYTKPIADFTYTFDCAKSMASFIDASSSDGNSINSWNWNFGDGNLSSEQNPTHNYTTDGAQSVTLISGSSANCSDTITQQVYLQSVTAEFNFESKCLYDSINFIDYSYTNGDTIQSYNWLFGDGNSSTEQNPDHLYLLSNTYSVILIATSSSGCVDSVTKTVEVYPVPSAGFDYYAEEYLINNTIEYTDLSSGSESWQWNFGDGITSTLQNPQHIYNIEGTYTITQVVSNNYTCVDTAQADITIEPGVEILPPKLPTAFSPNGDGMNDVYYPRGGPFKTIDFRVYNSWGVEIYSTQTVGEGWDGTYKGVDQQVGTYVWTVKAITVKGEEFIKTGDVTLIR